MYIAENVLPYGNCSALVRIVMLYKRICHVDTEAIAALVEPETAYILHSLSCCDTCRIVHALVPSLSWVQNAIVESRLALEEVDDVGCISRCLACDVVETCTAAEPSVSPHISVCVLICLGFLALGKPCMLLRCVAWNQVEKNVHVPLVSLSEEVLYVLHCSVSLGNLLVIPYIVACIGKW